MSAYNIYIGQKLNIEPLQNISKSFCSPAIREQVDIRRAALLYTIVDNHFYM